ncbi:SDR family oxidoreductase [uncultured Microscilla sp.]|uniref:SDR family oxidoreductase n=1 Tax=uncultured Microscilla sp. TaxID=432653 RepID=UPI00262E8E61|nr:SDR family oxidoreductase [uncultured Microscilla sp.]
MSKVILITGASSGIGNSMAVYLQQQGYAVYGTSRRAMPDSAVKMLKMDITNETEIIQGVKQVIENEGHIDVLINNAGLGTAGALEETPLSDIEQVFATNVMGVVRLTQEVLPYMRKQQSGKIINIGSIGGVMGLPYRATYCASKFAIDGLTEALRMEVAPFGVQVCSVLPGDVRTGINENRLTATNDTSVYKESFDRTHQIMNDDVMQGIAPEMVAKKIHKLIKKRQISGKYLVGKPLQKFTVFLKRNIPNLVFEQVIKMYYKV